MVFIGKLKQERLNMTRQEKIEELQDRVRHNKISNIDDLKLEISCAEYDGDEIIDEMNNVLSPIEFNICDKCGALYKSDELCWVDYLDPDYDQDLIDAVEAYDQELCAICYECAKELRHE